MAAIRRVAGRITLALTGATLLVGAIVQLGTVAQESLASESRYNLTVPEIECNPPAGQERSRFLAEVHYYGQLPERLSLLDPDLQPRLLLAFAQHPKVERVERVVVTATRQVRVDLVYRE